ncbi:MAG: UbiD family decarboxylase [Thermodesulfobacteriota bacterium]
MYFKDMRAFLKKLEQEGELKRIKNQVDGGDEIAALVWESYERKGMATPGLLFDNIKGYKIPLGVNIFGDYRRWALALGIRNWREITFKQIREFFTHYMEKQAGWKKPVTVSAKNAPCKEVVLKGEEANFSKFPIFRMHPDDGGPFITLPGVVMKDPKLGLNFGTYRMMLHDQRTTGLLCNILQDSGIYLARARKRGEKEMDVSVAIGYPPALYFASCMKMPSAAHSEYEFVGGFTGKPVELVKCETNDLLVPARAEIILEGKVSTEENRLEGPFGEWMGVTEEVMYVPVFRLNCITHRKNPLYTCATSGHMYSECQILYSVPWMNWYNEMKRSIVGFRDLAVPLEGRGYIAIIQITKRYPGWAKQALLTALGSGFGMATLNIAIVVDEDIDIYDWTQVLFALSTRVEPEQDVLLLPPVGVNALNPSARNRIQRDPSTGFTEFSICSKMGIDATKKFATEPGKTRSSFPLSRPKEEALKKVRDNWGKYGL